MEKETPKTCIHLVTANNHISTLDVITSISPKGLWKNPQRHPLQGQASYLSLKKMEMTLEQKKPNKQIARKKRNNFRISECCK